MKVDPCLSFCTKPNSRWIKDVRISSDTLNMIEEKVGNSLEPRVVANLWTVKDTITGTKEQFRGWGGKFIVNYTSNRGLIPSIYKILKI